MNFFFRITVLSLVTLLLAACASIGSPDGGEYDETPPKVIRAVPAQGAVDAGQKKIRIYFDEYIKLDNPSEKVTISPPQTEAPEIVADGKHISINLHDSLRANTTYTVDFGDAISDNNEGNPMGLYTYSFSTGPSIDTMEVSGTVLNASNLEPVKGISVGLYPCDGGLPDSIFRTQPLLRVGRTNGSGRFTIKGVKNGRYRAYALKDMDGNFRFTQKSEMLAYDTTSFQTSCTPDIRPDTIWHDTAHIEKIRMVPYIHYYPDNLTLLAFLEEGQDRHLLKMTRPTPEQFTVYFTAPSTEMPVIKGLNFDATTLLPIPSAHKDTITYWIPDTTVAYSDTLRFNMTYLDTDSLGQLVERTDSDLELVPKITHAKQLKEQKKKMEEWEKDRTKKAKKAKKPLKDEENPYKKTYITATVKPGSGLDPNQNVTLLFPEPLAKIDTSRIHFRQKIDSNYVDKPYLLIQDKVNPQLYTLYAEWEPKETYQLKADSLTFLSVLGHQASSIKADFRVRATEEFGSIFLKLSNLNLQQGDTAYVELLNKSDKVVARQAVKDGRADFFYLKPSDYYLRCFIDRNADHQWTTGDYDQQRQGEETFYFPRPIPLRALFEVEQSWDVRGIARNKQKPEAITKQKPDKAKTVKNRNQERASNGGRSR